MIVLIVLIIKKEGPIVQVDIGHVLMVGPPIDQVDIELPNTRRIQSSQSSNTSNTHPSNIQPSNTKPSNVHPSNTSNKQQSKSYNTQPSDTQITNTVNAINTQSSDTNANLPSFVNPQKTRTIKRRMDEKSRSVEDHSDY
ncbi:2549_t:CDS:2 [Funneliformis caledonium]|uniref:2549_t:CDS:1 n=1 Tax=Funneliformis caledonium TaxID=1117310 RepID=A0A9N9BS42_9GLOM|nr:2549_t:CDS:2 [Funneliformis caledonium]